MPGAVDSVARVGDPAVGAAPREVVPGVRVQCKVVHYCTCDGAVLALVQGVHRGSSTELVRLSLSAKVPFSGDSLNKII